MEKGLEMGLTRNGSSTGYVHPGEDHTSEDTVEAWRPLVHSGAPEGKVGTSRWKGEDDRFQLTQMKIFPSTKAF